MLLCFQDDHKQDDHVRAGAKEIQSLSIGAGLQGSGEDEDDCVADADERAEALRCPWLDCGASGCLYNLTADESESFDLVRAWSPGPPPARVTALLRRLHARLLWHNATVFSPNRGSEDVASACDAALHRYGGFWGPFVHSHKS